MRAAVVLLALSLAFPALSSSQTSAASDSKGGHFSIDDIDKSVDPCTDFYKFACGNWLRHAEIPADQPEWASFVEVEERNKLILRDILEKAANGGPNRDAIDQ